MIVISAKEVTKEYGTDVILNGVSFHINEGDRVGLIGTNGAGKTTLMRVLSGEISPTSGDFFIAQDTTVGYLKQKDELVSERTVIGEVEEIFDHIKDMEKKCENLSTHIAQCEAGSREQEELINRHHSLVEEIERAGGYTYQSEIRGVLSGMGFCAEEYSKAVDVLSGGERTRLYLAMLLLRRPNLLLLDEPTNHLDIDTLKWLEQYIKGYKGTILVVSHDRYFLDRTVNRIFEIEGGNLGIYEGNYTTFAEKKKMIRREDMRKYKALKKETEKQEEMIRRYKSHGTEKLAKRAQSREKRLAKTLKEAGEQGIEMPNAEPGAMRIHFKEKFKSGNDVISAENLSKSFGYGTRRRQLFSHVNLDIKRGEKICLVGPNGIGKTTLIKILMGEEEADGGFVKRGHNVKFGYYDQGQRLMNESNTVLEELHDVYTMYNQTELRKVLGSFLFRGDQVFLPISALSGGEKARLALLKLMMSGANVLLMDEPTNHLDIASKEVFEEALFGFPGAVVIISHDRYLLSKIPTRILELGKEGLRTFYGKYHYYMEKKQELEEKARLEDLRIKEELLMPSFVNKSVCDENVHGLQAGSAEERRLKKLRDMQLRREKREQEQLERDIEMMEEDIASIEEEMCEIAVSLDPIKLQKLDKKLSDKKEKLSVIYEKWLQY